MQLPRWAERIGPYAIVASIVTIIDYSVFITLVRMTGIAPILANVCSWAVAVVAAYGLHSTITFDMPASMRGFLGYVAVCLSTLIIGTSILAISLLYITPIAAKAASTIIVFAASFALSRATVFRTAKL
jgi:putative flippase GtrA